MLEDWILLVGGVVGVLLLEDCILLVGGVVVVLLMEDWILLVGGVGRVRVVSVFIKNIIKPQYYKVKYKVNHCFLLFSFLFL